MHVSAESWVGNFGSIDDLFFFLLNLSELDAELESDFGN